MSTGFHLLPLSSSAMVTLLVLMSQTFSHLVVFTLIVLVAWNILSSHLFVVCLLSFLHSGLCLNVTFPDKLSLTTQKYLNSLSCLIFVHTSYHFQVGCNCHEGKDLILFSGIYFQHLEQCLTYSTHTVNIC